MNVTEKNEIELTPDWQDEKLISPVLAKKIVTVGKCTLATAGCLAFLGVLIPIILLKSIRSELHNDFKMNQLTEHIWRAIPGNRSISHLKSFYYFSITDDEHYYKFNGANLTTTSILLYRKKMAIENLKTTDFFVSGVLNETYELDEDYNPNIVFNEKLKQIRPGFLKAVQLIESKTLA